MFGFLQKLLLSGFVFNHITWERFSIEHEQTGGLLMLNFSCIVSVKIVMRKLHDAFHAWKPEKSEAICNSTELCQSHVTVV